MSAAARRLRDPVCDDPPAPSAAWRAAAAHLPRPLTPRELEVVAAYLEYPGAQAAAVRLGMSVAVLDRHAASIAEKVTPIGVPDRPGRVGHVTRIVWWVWRCETRTAR